MATLYGTDLLRGRRRVEWVLGGDGLLGLEVGRVSLGADRAHQELVGAPLRLQGRNSIDILGTLNHVWSFATCLNF